VCVCVCSINSGIVVIIYRVHQKIPDPVVIIMRDSTSN